MLESLGFTADEAKLAIPGGQFFLFGDKADADGWHGQSLRLADVMLHEHFTKSPAAGFRQNGKPHEVGNSGIGGLKGGTARDGGAACKERIGHTAFQIVADPRFRAIGRVFGAILGREPEAQRDILVGLPNQAGQGRAGRSLPPPPPGQWPPQGGPPPSWPQG